MSRQGWAIQKNSKFFYIRVYRWSLAAAAISSLINIFLVILVCFVQTHQPPRAYYATSGVTAPIELTPETHPNDSSVPLLPSDPATPEPPKMIPS